ncbi:MAG TPA: HEAT repeat domain-containing protein [Bacteroidia bacterium]|jgi:DNA-directed RNA polymerase
MNIEKLIEQVIPPNDYEHRNEFSNTHIVDSLNEHEKEMLENALINKLLEHDDTLVIETLAYIKSEKALPLLYDYLKRCSNEMAKIISAVSIFQINNDSSMISVAIDSFKQIEINKDAYFKYKLAPAFHYLVKFNNSIVNNMIEKYTTHGEYLISYNAKKALGYNL